MRHNIISFQNKVLKALSNKIDDFYLAGGTALSLYYFHHRESLDLDFFTKEFSRARIFEVAEFLSHSLKRKVELMAEESRKNRIKMLIWSIAIDKKSFLKVNFVQDYLGLIRPPKPVNGIKILSLEDIYMRKIYAISGTTQTTDLIGREITQGGRQTAKDLFDLYCLSQIFMKLSDFSFKYGNQLLREGIIRWFRTYSRMDMKTGLLELKLKKNVDYSEIERHFKKEINEIIDKEVGFS